MHAYIHACMYTYMHTYIQQRGHLETAPPFTVPCGGREAQ